MSASGTEATVFDARRCALGEGALWHPERRALFWFDILGKRLLWRDEAGRSGEWPWEEHVSAAGWVDRERLVVASETALWSFSLADGRRERLCPLEADLPRNRSNDGRADPWGGFWIGTMGKAAEPGAGAIWRWYRGELRRLFGGLTITNAIAFDPLRPEATFADTRARRVMRVPLDPATGWPSGPARPWLDLGAEELNPDGAVFDAEGGLWVALWGAGRVQRFLPDGRAAEAVAVPASQASCPAFGGADQGTLFVTSAAVGAPRGERAAGLTFRAPAPVAGRPEPRVILP
ncbi:MAG: SMP-30/gluconolactonase/LRE family protein [Alphaproteobacteria bacterium]|nr:MAG: SMP-30/gluconolactonase/LRE family protein [Alphaproteobacteria bacterium]